MSLSCALEREARLHEHVNISLTPNDLTRFVCLIRCLRGLTTPQTLNYVTESMFDVYVTQRECARSHSRMYQHLHEFHFTNEIKCLRRIGRRNVIKDNKKYHARAFVKFFHMTYDDCSADFIFVSSCRLENSCRSSGLFHTKFDYIIDTCLRRVVFE